MNSSIVIHLFFDVLYYLYITLNKLFEIFYFHISPIFLRINIFVVFEPKIECRTCMPISWAFLFGQLRRKKLAMLFSSLVSLGCAPSSSSPPPPPRFFLFFLLALPESPLISTVDGWCLLEVWMLLSSRCCLFVSCLQ